MHLSTDDTGDHKVLLPPTLPSANGQNRRYATGLRTCHGQERERGGSQVLHDDVTNTRSSKDAHRYDKDAPSDQDLPEERRFSAVNPGTRADVRIGNLLSDLGLQAACDSPNRLMESTRYGSPVTPGCIQAPECRC
jgi:hypothetical protein